MTYNEFRLRFAIQYVGGVSDPGECMRRMDNAPALARLLWDVMNAPEVIAPAAPAAPIAPDLKAIGRAALEASNNKARWVAIDASGGVWAYDLRPDYYETDRTWDNSPNQGSNWFVRVIAPPADFTKEIYEISALLDDEQ